MNATQILDPPRWVGGPQICPVANLPAFETPEALQAFFGRWESGSIMVKWRCQICHCFHAWPKPHAPSGGTSGKTRYYEIPDRINELIKLTAAND